MELAKLNEENEVLHVEYSKLVQEQNEVEQREGRLKKAVQEVYNKFL
jgi:hypothetical protein